MFFKSDGIRSERELLEDASCFEAFSYVFVQLASLLRLSNVVRLHVEANRLKEMIFYIYLATTPPLLNKYHDNKYK